MEWAAQVRHQRLVRRLGRRSHTDQPLQRCGRVNGIRLAVEVAQRGWHRGLKRRQLSCILHCCAIVQSTQQALAGVASKDVDINPVHAGNSFEWPFVCRVFSVHSSMYNPGYVIIKEGMYWSEPKRHRKTRKDRRRHKSSQGAAAASKLYLSWPLGGPPSMGAASAAYCALSAGSKPIEEVVPKVIPAWQVGAWATRLPGRA